MPVRQLSRHFSIRARESQRKLKHESRKMATVCCLDFFDRKLVPVKIAFFFIMGATQCIAPYSTLLMKALGLTVEETAIIFTVGPLIPIIAPLLAGILTDKIGNFRIFLVTTVFLSGILSLFYVAIPPARTKVFINQKDTVDLELLCEAALKFKISYVEPDNCISPSSPVTVKNLYATHCGYLCTPPAIEMESQIQKNAKNLTVTHFHNDTYGVACEIGFTPKQKCYSNNLNDTEIYTKSFSLRDASFDLSNVKKVGNVVSSILNNYMMTPSDASIYDCKTGRLSSDVSIRKLVVTSSSAKPEASSGNPIYVKCKFHCKGSLNISSVCNNTSDIIVHDVPLSFWLFLVNKMISTFMIGLTYSMFEAGVVAILKENNYNYGIQRVYGSFGGMIFAPLTGYLIDHFGHDNHYSDYFIAFYFYCCVKLLCALILTQMDLNFRSPSKNICGNITNIFKTMEILLLILIVFISGMCYGFIEHFLPWHIRDLGAENWVIGLMTTVASIASIPFLIVSDFLCRKFGFVQCISFGLVCYAIRCFGYSMIKNPYWCFPFEVLEGITTGLLVAASIIYGAKLCQQSNLGTLQGILATSHYGFGKSAGSLVGGFLMGKLGARIAFRIFSGGAFLFAFTYYLIFKLIYFPKMEELERKRREVSAMQIEVVPKEDLSMVLPINEDKSLKEDGFPMTSTPKKSIVYA